MGEITNNRLRALIVDDEVDICFLLKGILKSRKIEASYVTSLTEAVELLKGETPSIIFLDNHLPDGRGVSYIGRFKKQLPDTKIIMITAHDTSSDREMAYNEGVDFFIGKPFTREIILQTVEKFIPVE